MSISPNLTIIKDSQPVNISVEEVLRYNTEKLVKDLEKELLIDLNRLQEKLHAKTLEQIFIEQRIYKKIEECKTYKAVVDTVGKALAKFDKKLLRPVTTEDIERLLEIRIKRISRYDINRQSKEIKEIKSSIKDVEKSLKDIVGFTINHLDALLKKYGKYYPRRTAIDTFTEVKARKVALSNLTVGYHRETGLLGHQVKTDCEMNVSCSEFDKILLIYKDGRFKAIKVLDKIFVDHDLLWAGKVSGKIIFNLIYREGAQNVSYVKRFNTPKFILDKEYRLFKAHKKSWIQFLQTGEGVRVRVDFIPLTRAKTNSLRLHLDEYLIKGAGAKGKRLSTRHVRRISELSSKVVEAGSPDEQPVAELKDQPVQKTVKKTPVQKDTKKPQPPVKSKKNDVVPESPEDGDSAVPKEESKKSKKQLGLFNLKKSK